MPTLQQLQEAAAGLLGCLYRGQVTSATTTSITDSALEDRWREDDLERAWAVVGSATRRVVGYDPRRGTIVLGAPLSAAPIAGTAYAIYFRLPPDDWQEAVNRALERLSYTEAVPLAVVAGQESYAVPGVTHRHQVEQVVLRRQRSDGTFEEQPVWFEPLDTGFRVQPVVFPLAGDQLVATVRSYWARLTSPSDVSTVPLLLGAAAAALEAAVTGLARASQAEMPIWQALHQRALAEFMSQARRFIPPAHRPVLPTWPMDAYQRPYLPTG